MVSISCLVWLVLLVSVLASGIRTMLVLLRMCMVPTATSLGLLGFMFILIRAGTSAVVEVKRVLLGACVRCCCLVDMMSLRSLGSCLVDWL